MCIRDRLYIKSKLPSLAQTLAAQNYSRSALHVYYRTSWQRDVNYPLLGYERFDSIESFIDNDAIDEYRNGNKSFLDFQAAVKAQYPNDNVLLRSFVSDEFDYKLLEQMYEERDTSKPFHIFNVTMQNHGSYNSGYTNFNQQIRLTSMAVSYTHLLRPTFSNVRTPGYPLSWTSAADCGIPRKPDDEIRRLHR